MKDSQEPSLDDVLQPGKNMVAAGYCMYGSSCMVQKDCLYYINNAFLFLRLEFEKYVLECYCQLD